MNSSITMESQTFLQRFLKKSLRHQKKSCAAGLERGLCMEPLRGGNCSNSSLYENLLKLKPSTVHNVSLENRSREDAIGRDHTPAETEIFT